ncbi:TAXI family TRAP transporter solute-binding subunit [Leucothrix arctica]|uniref:C4-dicarboxylate ABC transporter substrate-binding protein n=1 Tax=Leucothrix arctica TaxID=1481894 RepID=A0A317CD56_9GAMM|nr:TAXI family TRAP transporter solute-binding subunit [Leucothrix arctica]PWQ96319.1 hypothetical protein DKT75_10055 [Leucothrix arctica]
MIRVSFLLSAWLLAANASAATNMPTGAEGGTYHAIGVDISRITPLYGVDINVISSVGSVDNIRQLFKNNEVDLSLAQSDVIAAFKKSPQATTQSAIQNLRLVLPLYQEEVHILANKSIQTISDLAGKRVGVGRIGSGTHITATNILRLLKLKTLPNNKLSPLDAYKALLFGELDAVFFVSGKPINFIQGMLEMNDRQDLKSYVAGIHLLAIEDDRLNESYDIASIDPNDYVSKNRKHKLTNISIPTISVTAALVTRVFPDDNKWVTGKRCREIGRVHRAISNRLHFLASGGTAKNKFHPKWASVDLKHPIDLEVSDCVKAKIATKKVIKATTSSEIVAPDQNKVEVHLNAEEIAEAHCLLTTHKPCSSATIPDDSTLEPLL